MDNLDATQVLPSKFEEADAPAARHRQPASPTEISSSEVLDRPSRGTGDTVVVPPSIQVSAPNESPGTLVLPEPAPPPSRHHPGDTSVIPSGSNELRPRLPEKEKTDLPDDDSSPSSLLGKGVSESDPAWAVTQAPVERVGSGTQDQGAEAPSAVESQANASPGSLAKSAGDPSFVRYRMQRELARGGLGCVWLATDTHLAREVAVKDLLPRALKSHSLVERFYREAQVTGQLEHPGIVPIYELSVKPNGTPYYAMKLLRGQSYNEAIGAYHNLSPNDPQKLPKLHELLGVFVDVCNAMAFAHSRGVIHRDLKPHNIMLGEFGEALVVDWGLAKLIGAPDIFADDSITASEAEATAKSLSSSGLVRTTSPSNHSKTQHGSMLGTPSYMSPEQASGDIARLDARSDIFALGTILYDLLTGKPPYDAEDVFSILGKAAIAAYEPVRKANPNVPPALAAICEKAMARRHEDRYQSAKSLGADINSWLTGEPVSAYAEPLLDRAVRWMNRHRSACFSTGVSAVVVAVVVGLWSFADARRLEKLRNECVEIVLAGQAKFSSGDLAQAKELLTLALAKIGSEPKLMELKQDASQILAQSELMLAEANRQQSARSDYDRFQMLRDDALYHGTLVTGVDTLRSLDAAHTSARSALEIYKVSDQTIGPPKLDDRYHTDEQRQRVATWCYELMLTMAEATILADDGRTTPAQRAQAALKTLDRVEKLGPPTHAYHQLRSNCLREIGDLAGAERQQQLADAMPPSTAMDYFFIARQHYHSGRLEAALEAFDRVLRKDPGHFWAHYFAAVCYLKLGKPEHAVASFTALASRRSDFVWLYSLRGHSYSELGDFETAEHDFEAALKLKPNEYGVYVNRAASRLRQKRFEDATNDLKKAISLKPEVAIAYISLAKVYAQQKRYPEALAEIEKALARSARIADAYRVRAGIYTDQGNHKAAVIDYGRAIALEAKGALAVADDLFNLGAAHRELKAHDQAVEAFDQALEINAKHPQAHRLKADSLLVLGRRADAMRAMDEHLENSETDAETLRRRALERSGMGDHGGALADLGRAIDEDPKAAFTRGRRGWTLLNHSRQVALADFDEAISADPKNADLYAGRGFALVTLGKYRESVQDAEKAIELAGTSQDWRLKASVFLNAGCIYSQALAQVTFAANESKREDLKSHYRQRAVELVRQSIEAIPPPNRANFFQGSVVGDPSLNPIRDTSEYAKLVAEMKAGVD